MASKKPMHAPLPRAARLRTSVPSKGDPMGEIILVRHGQANSGATDEESYDRLSDLGHQQARWLGDYLRDREAPFDKVISGSLRRHRETATGIGYDAPQIDPRLNEMDYFNLGQALEDVHGVPFPGPEEFAAHVPQVMEAWHRAEIHNQRVVATTEQRHLLRHPHAEFLAGLEHKHGEVIVFRKDPQRVFRFRDSRFQQIHAQAWRKVVRPGTCPRETLKNVILYPVLL